MICIRSFIILVILLFTYINSTSIAQAVSRLPQLKIVSPSDNQTVMGDKISVSFIVGNLRVGKEGHLHLWLDTDNETATGGYAEIQTHFDYQINGISNGNHKLMLEVVKPDHKSFSPRVIERVAFKTELPSSPSPTITVIETNQTNNSAVNYSLFLTLGILAVTCGIYIGFKWNKNDI